MKNATPATFEIIPVMELDPEDMDSDLLALKTEAVTEHLYAVSDLLVNLEPIVRYFLLEYAEFKEIYVWGGYVFRTANSLNLGAVDAYALARHWNWAFEKIRKTTVVDFDSYAKVPKNKLVRDGETVTIYFAKHGELSCPRDAFYEKSERAVQQMRAFMSQLWALLKPRLPQSAQRQYAESDFEGTDNPYR